jgi:hypothetical protein
MVSLSGDGHPIADIMPGRSRKPVACLSGEFVNNSGKIAFWTRDWRRMRARKAESSALHTDRRRPRRFHSARREVCVPSHEISSMIDEVIEPLTRGRSRACNQSVFQRSGYRFAQRKRVKTKV